MLVRFVKMTFREEEVESFLAYFDQYKEQIRNFEGCTYLQVLQDQNHPNIIFSHSFWESQDALNNYRYSDLFRGVWAETKKRFAAKPEAWSLDVLHDMP